MSDNESSHGCRCCGNHTWTIDGLLPRGWHRIDHVDGPNAICPECVTDPNALDALKEDGYENAKILWLTEGVDR